MNRPTVLEINKAKVILFPIKSVRSVEINTLIKCGSWYEDLNEFGIFHFLEHMLFHGTKNMPSSEIMMNSDKINGFYTNAYTRGDAINFYLNTPDINLNQALKTIEDVIFYPIFPEDKIPNELKVVTQELKSKWDRPETRFFHQVNEFIFGQNHIYTRDNIGNINCLQKITSKKLKYIHKKYFQPQNLVISIVGNIKSTNDIVKKLTKILNHHPNTHKSHLVYPSIKPSSQKEFIYHDKPDQETISLIWIIQKNKKINRLTKMSQRIFSYTLGNSVDSILFKIFRIKYGLVYSIKSNISNYKNCSIFEIFCQIDPQNSTKFFEIFNSEFQDILSQITPDKLNQTIKYTNYQELMTYDSLDNISNTITNEAFNYKLIYLPEDYIKLSKKINLSKTIEFFRKKLTIKNRYTFRMTPIKPEQ
jgi:predicted Zn-dependent peptidase